MKRFAMSLLRRALKDECGQTAVVIAVTLGAIVGLGGVTIEVGHAYYAYELLKASTNVATMAGAAAMPDTGTAASLVTEYSSMAGDKNASPLLQNVQATPTFLCLSTVSTTFKTPCATSTGASGGYNSLSVKQTAKVPLWFGGLIGISKLNISATSTASMKGGADSPWNIAIVLDTTGSMGSQDGGKQCSGTQISCALQGVQSLLGDLYPCALGQTCTSSSSYVDSVSLYAFPPVLASTADNDYCAGGSGGGSGYGGYGGRGGGSSTPTHEYYEVSALPSTWTYQIIGFSNDYRTTDSTSGLNTSSNIVKAIGYSGSSCSGMQAIGGAGTYYAQAIYQAQSDLIAQQTANPNSRNAMIVLSDGDATATVTCTGRGSCSTTNDTISSSSDLQPSSTNSLNGVPWNNSTSYTYPSAVGECGQAVVAAQAAATAGTSVYTIGYGAETSGCTTDATYSDPVTTNGGTWGPGDSPCQALAAMASEPINFYSDDGSGCTATVPSNAAITQLTAIFHQISGSMTTARLIPNGTE